MAQICVSAAIRVRREQSGGIGLPASCNALPFAIALSLFRKRGMNVVND
jgi:hypothetical protein